MVSENDICIFQRPSGECSVLKYLCHDHSSKCNFRKTKEEFIKGHDAAILKNREKGRCETCTYVRTPCLLSSEDAYDIDSI